MVEIDWRLALGIITLVGGVLLAAAKSIFVTKSKIYDDNGITIFVQKSELKEVCKEKHRILDDTFGVSIVALNKITANIISRSEWLDTSREFNRRQSEIEKGLSKLYGLLERKDGASI